MRDEMIFNIICIDSLGSPSGSYKVFTEILIQVNFFKDHRVPILLLIYIIPFKQLVQGIKHIFRCLQGRHLWYKVILLALTKFFLCKDFSLISLWNWNLFTYVGAQFIFHQASVISHFEMRTSNVNSKKIRSYRFEVFILVLELLDLGFARETLNFKT